MEKLSAQAAQIMDERFGRDTVIALATLENGLPRVRSVDALYAGGAFYIVTDARSGKMRQLAVNPACAVSGEWFSAQGCGENLGAFGAPENAALAARLRAAFDWLDNGHSDLGDPNCVILKIALTQGVLLSHGTRYDIDFAR